VAGVISCKSKIVDQEGPRSCVSSKPTIVQHAVEQRVEKRQEEFTTYHIQSALIGLEEFIQRSIDFIKGLVLGSVIHHLPRRPHSNHRCV
jgi:hypothetical protein